MNQRPNHLLQLALRNQASAPAQRCQLLANADNPDTAEVLLKGVISADFGVGADDLRAALQMADGRPVRLHINSPGGDVFEAREMQAEMSRYGAPITAVVQGLAASAATIVAMAAQRTEIVAGSRYMIHNAWTLAMGNRHDLRAVYDLLAAIDGELAAEYAARSADKLTPAQAATLMDAETWWTAQQTVDYGLAAQVLPNAQPAASAAASAAARAIAARWDLSAYANAPADPPAALPADDPETTAQQAQRLARLNRSRLAALLTKN